MVYLVFDLENTRAISVNEWKAIMAKANKTINFTGKGRSLTYTGNWELRYKYHRIFSDEEKDDSDATPTLKATVVVGEQSLPQSSGTTLNPETGLYELNEGTMAKEVWGTVAKMANFNFEITHPARDWQPVVRLSP